MISGKCCGPSGAYGFGMSTKVTHVLSHLAGIVFFLTIPLVFSPEQQIGPHLQREWFSYLLMVGFFYLNYHVLIPRLYFHKKYFWFVTLILACYLFITFLPQQVFQFTDPFEGRGGPFPPPPGTSGPPSPELMRHVGHTIFLFFLVVFLSLAMKINSQWKQTEKERLHTELSFLKAQVNPHFLFNTLNSIYALAIEKSEETAHAVVKLSGMMRYVLHDARQDFVSLPRELECIGDFIDLQKIRWGDSIPIHYQVTGDPSGKRIAPVILQPFIENAFKHGVSTEEKAPIDILIHIGKEWVSMQVRNVKVKSAHAHEEKSGLGIENTRLRLDLIYPSAYTLTLQEDEKTFQINLQLNLKS